MNTYSNGIFQNPEAARISHLVTFFIILIMIERRINYQDGRIGYQDGSKPNGRLELRAAAAKQMMRAIRIGFIDVSC